VAKEAKATKETKSVKEMKETIETNIKRDCTSKHAVEFHME
jgi:hypothetical protein